MADPSVNFGEAAGRYEAFRPSYPREVFEFLLKHAASGRARAVDLGAGTGQATRALAGLFEHVTAVEHDRRLAEAMRLPANAEIMTLSAEAAAFAHASIDAVISATAFHWMDQKLVCRKAVEWLKPGGAFFPFAYDAFEVGGSAGDFYNAEFRKWDAYRDRRLLDCYDYARALKDSGAFQTVIPFAIKFRDEISHEAAAGLISTFSFARLRPGGRGRGLFRVDRSNAFQLRRNGRFLRSGHRRARREALNRPRRLFEPVLDGGGDQRRQRLPDASVIAV